MSNALAIATVTQTLRNVLFDAIGAAKVHSASVTFVRPDDTANVPATGVNVFLYQVTPNTALRNSDLPTRGADGQLLQRPQVALDLFYLITFYGDDTKLEQQRLLGAVTLALHANPTLAVADIQSAQSAPYLAGADLDTQAERVRFRPISFSLEELSKLWSFLLKTDYVLSAAYVASVVLIDAAETIPAPLPVLDPRLVVTPLAPPIVTAIVPAPGSGSVIQPGALIIIQGSALLGPAGTTTVVQVGRTALTPSYATPTSLTVQLPSTLTAGTQTATVVQQLMLGTPPVPHPSGVQSDPSPFTLCPLIRRTESPLVYQITVQTNVPSPPNDAITVTLDPTIQPGQSVVLVLRPVAAGAPPLLFNGPAITAATNAAVFDLKPPPGDYFVQVIVDGAQSPLDIDAGGQPIGPRVTL
jgi:hypothetical protein